jgi:hypothetical protein
MMWAGAGAWVIPPSQDRQAYLGRRVTITRNWAGSAEDQERPRWGVSPTNIQPVADILANDMMLCPAGAGDVMFDNHFNPFQMLGQ